MNSVKLSEEVAQKLKASTGRVTLCDSQGHVIGYYEPINLQPISTELLQWAREQISDDELERRLQDKNGISTEELLRRLDAL